MPLGTHARVGEYLRDGIASGWRFFKLVGSAQRLDVVHRMVVGDVLQGIGDAVDDVLLFDDRHGLTRRSERSF
jgi:hypothetical protein